MRLFTLLPPKSACPLMYGGMDGVAMILSAESRKHGQILNDFIQETFLSARIAHQSQLFRDLRTRQAEAEGQNGQGMCRGLEGIWQLLCFPVRRTSGIEELAVGLSKLRLFQLPYLHWSA